MSRGPVNVRLDHLERVEVAGTRELRAWLAENHARGQSVWLVTGKKQAGAGYIPYAGIVEELLCFGWIDSLPRALDERRAMLLISPRKPGSAWSKDNRERIARLEAEGRMAAPGRAVVEAARADGAWERLVQTESGEAPPELAEALAAAGARAGWDCLSLSVRRRSLELLLAAKRPETRAARIARIVAAAREGKDPTAWRPKV